MNNEVARAIDELGSGPPVLPEWLRTLANEDANTAEAMNRLSDVKARVWDAVDEYPADSEARDNLVLVDDADNALQEKLACALVGRMLATAEGAQALDGAADFVVQALEACTEEHEAILESLEGEL
jgi:hypothetical protein